MQIASAKDSNPVYGAVTYYGRIKEIWELDYRTFTIPVFMCDWVDSRGVKKDDFGFTVVNFGRLCHQSERFILASQARQVFYVQDQQDKNLSVVGFTPHKMYKYGDDVENDDMLEFDATVDVVFWAMADPENEKVSHEDDSDHEDQDSKSQRGPTVKSKTEKKRVVVTYNKRGVPYGETATKLSTFEGMCARTMVPITYERWFDVGDQIKEACWKHVLANFVLNPKGRKRSLQSVGTKWKNFKHTLYKKFILARKDDPEADLLTPPAMYPFLKEPDWKLFVAQHSSKQWEERSKKAKKTRAKNRYNHRLSRKGYSGLIEELVKETGKEEEEIDRATCWKKARQLKSGGFDLEVQKVVDKIEELEKEDKHEDVSCGTEDVLTQALGNDEQRGRVRGMGKFVSHQQYFHLPKTVKGYLDKEKKKINRRLTKVEDQLERLTRGGRSATPVSEAASCQMGNDDEEAPEDDNEHADDKSCYLAVDVPTNIVARGTVMNWNDSDENIEVMVQTCVQGEASLPFPLEEEFVEKVQDALGYILRWPRHLVIQFSDLTKMAKKKKKTEKVEDRKDVKKGEDRKDVKKGEETKDVKKTKKVEERKDEAKMIEATKDEERKDECKETGKGNKKRQRDLDKQKDDFQVITGEAVNEFKERKKSKVIEKESLQRKIMTRGQRKKRVRMESFAMSMAAMMVDGQMTQVDSIKVSCEDDLFGYDSFTYLNWNDFDSVFAMDVLSGAVISSYTMYLYEQIKNGGKVDHGICFITPTATMQFNKKGMIKNVDDSSRLVADRLKGRKGNDIRTLGARCNRHEKYGLLLS
ncbi:hypothetical protein SSX86_003931 [Deinandra increscens subsp. villosa]|uniref:DUF4216 domain-containing protein n=1 Tax=Deinandra increscens subsp. villosa TaxID=3103831 RepID=A0AAP0DM16_9ASTR